MNLNKNLQTMSNTITEKQYLFFKKQIIQFELVQQVAGLVEQYYETVHISEWDYVQEVNGMKELYDTMEQKHMLQTIHQTKRVYRTIRNMLKGSYTKNEIIIYCEENLE